MPLAVRVTRRAARQIESAAQWWEQNRPAATGAILASVEQVLSLLATQPRIGAVARSARMTGIRRVHLTLVNYDLYNRVTNSGIDV